jgi:hypothetical protein
MIENIITAYAIGFAFCFGVFVGQKSPSDGPDSYMTTAWFALLWPFGIIYTVEELCKHYLCWRRQ